MLIFKRDPTHPSEFLDSLDSWNKILEFDYEIK
jgi:hypothetical protein